MSGVYDMLVHESRYCTQWEKKKLIPLKNVPSREQNALHRKFIETLFLFTQEYQDFAQIESCSSAKVMKNTNSTRYIAHVWK